MDANNDPTGNSTNDYVLYGVKLPRGGDAELTGEYIIDASAQPNPVTSEMAVTLSMNRDGSRIWRDITTRAAADNNRSVAIVLDSLVVSAPSVRGPIEGGNTEITGGFDIQEASDLAGILKVGSLPARTEIIQQSVVGPTLGEENIRSSIIALVIGFLIVLGFMMFYYGGGGIISIICLLLNLVFIFGALASYGTVLTLPGIAGIVLTIGMAVDANVIIFERIREELIVGKGLSTAIADGFKQSYSAIIDANVTTILVAIVLAYFGLGPIKGFAVVLIIGVLSSLFTAVLVGRLAIEWWLGRGKDKRMSFYTSASKGLFSNLNIDWMGKRKMAYILSGVLLAISLVSILTRGFDLSVDFRGGYSYVVEFAQPVNGEELRTDMDAAFPDASTTVKSVSTDNTFNIVTSYLIDEQVSEEVGAIDPADRVMRALYEGVVAATGDTGLAYEDFSSADAQGVTHVTTFSKVGPTIADDIFRSSLEAGIAALLLIFLYIGLRFSKWQYSAGAVAALFHDSIIVLGLFSLLHGIVPFNLEIDQAFIAAILTVIGYSINDTVIVFDRIREYLNQYTTGNKTEIINSAINSTVSRTIITSLTTIFVVAVLFFFGGDSIRGFAFSLMMGIIVGTYSSIFIATPIVHDLTGDMRATNRKKTSSSESFSKPLATR